MTEAQAITADLPSDQQSKSVLFGFECPYCGGRTKFCDSKVIYGKSYGMIYWCQPCDAYVGVHKARGRRSHALGRLANRELREWKKAAHAHFDGLWQASKKKSRRANAYAWLAREMGLDPWRTHIGMFNVEQCQQVVFLCKQLVASLTAPPMLNEQPCGCHDDPVYGHVIMAGCPEHD